MCMHRLLASFASFGSLIRCPFHFEILRIAINSYMIFYMSVAGTSQYMFVEFVSSPAGPLLNTGFHFNVGNWPGHVDTAGVKSGACDWLLSSNALKESNASEGIFLSIAHWYPPNTSCSYHIQGNEGEIVRLYFPR